MTQSPSDSGALEGQVVEGTPPIGYEPLLPAEKKLIAGSLILGLALLGLLLWLSATYFPMSGH
jgi:hypothetical protein